MKFDHLREDRFVGVGIRSLETIEEQDSGGFDRTQSSLAIGELDPGFG